jgi:hypothetical protein
VDPGEAGRWGAAEAERAEGPGVAGAEPDGGGVDGAWLGRAGIDGVADGNGSGNDGNGGALGVGRGGLGKGRLGKGRLGKGRLGRGRVGSGSVGSGGGNVGSASVRVGVCGPGRIASFNGRAPDTGATTSNTRIDPHNQPATASLECANEGRVRRGLLLSIDGSGMAGIHPTDL